jgi:hypothetical protein
MGCRQLLYVFCFSFAHSLGFWIGFRLMFCVGYFVLEIWIRQTKIIP